MSDPSKKYGMFFFIFYIKKKFCGIIVGLGENGNIGR